MKGNLPSVRFFGEPNFKSGYGNATRNFCYSFSESKINTSFFFSKKISKSFIKKLINYPKECDIDFYIHTPPFSRHRSNKYKIGYFYWEADSLPIEWQRDILCLNEIWAPCKLVKKACLRAGFRGPIEILPTPFSRTQEGPTDTMFPSPISDNFLLSDGIFKFYSIFQWHKRKGYSDLLKAYYEEFSADDNVVLIIKTHPLAGERGSVDKIKFDILSIKNRINKKRPAKVFLITDFLEKNQIDDLHRGSDCFVLPHRGEGWGMPIHDALLAGNHVIATKYGGITEFLDEDSLHIIPHDIGPVREMPWTHLYSSSQSWAYPKYICLKEIMRDVYKNKSNNYYIDRCNNGKSIAESFSIESCSKNIEKILSKDRFKQMR
tara:strand:- start:1560 stop:2690 length:1131 start_codon:yes stop_codon:yes gene_type:complete